MEEVTWSFLTHLGIAQIYSLLPARTLTTSNTSEVEATGFVNQTAFSFFFFPKATLFTSLKAEKQGDDGKNAAFSQCQ